MVGHARRPLTLYNLTGCFDGVYPISTILRNIQKSFSVTGVFFLFFIPFHFRYLIRRRIFKLLRYWSKNKPEFENTRTNFHTIYFCSLSSFDGPSSRAVLVPLMANEPEPMPNAPEIVINTVTAASFASEPISNYDAHIMDGCIDEDSLSVCDECWKYNTNDTGAISKGRGLSGYLWLWNVIANVTSYPKTLPIVSSVYVQPCGLCKSCSDKAAPDWRTKKKFKDGKK